jgi:hypothetical protein
LILLRANARSDLVLRETVWSAVASGIPRDTALIHDPVCIGVQGKVTQVTLSAGSSGLLTVSSAVALA